MQKEKRKGKVKHALHRRLHVRHKKGSQLSIERFGPAGKMGPATLTAEILLSVRACVRARQEHGTRDDILFETKIELRNDVISALLGMCQAIVTMTTSTMICIRCLMNLLLWSPRLSCIILITCDGLAVVVTG